MCENYQDLMSSYIDNELSEEEKSDFEKHLADCPSCAQELAQLQDMLDTLHELPQFDLPQGFHDELMERLKLEKGEKKNIFRRRFNTNMRPNLNFRPYVNAAAAFIVTFLLLSVFAVTMRDMGRMPQTGGGTYEGAAESMPAAEPSVLAPEMRSASTPDAIVSAPAEAAAEEPSAAVPEMPKADAGVAEYSLDVPGENMNGEVPESRLMMNTQEAAADVVIRQSYLEIETEDLEQAIEYINSLGGDTLNSYSSGGGYFDYYGITKRIDNEEYALFLEELRSAGEIVSQSSSTNKVNSAVSELDLSAGRKEEERRRLLELMAGTGDISSLIAIEDRLDTIENELDDFRGRQQSYEIESSTSWLEITLRQKTENAAAKLTLAERAAQSFVSSANMTIAFIENGLVSLSFIFVPLVILAVLAAAAVFVHKKRKKR